MASSHDRDLGMHRQITRRDFIQGVAVPVGGALVVARQPFGSITIANSDAAASPHTDAAILEAHRAVQEVIQRRSMPMLGASL